MMVGGGATGIVVINHRVSISTERLQISKWILFYSSLCDISPAQPLIYSTLSSEALLIHTRLTATDIHL